ncbi:MAG: hypothetical protein M1838_004747 [Thelocarpon superellum]|nr:MAG: hypothetical protein M1838_004747 [Thelocarpon superellum]
MTEHFSTPLYFAQRYFNLQATLVPFPSGTGHMITALHAGEIDVGIGLTEGWVAGLAKALREGGGPATTTTPTTTTTATTKTATSTSTSVSAGAGAEKNPAGYILVGTYVETPLCWAISTGADRDEVRDVADLRGANVGVSRLGSGSHVMSFVLADQQGWLGEQQAKEGGGEKFSFVPLQTFAALREGVGGRSRKADFFMWEYFTSKRYFLPVSPVPPCPSTTKDASDPVLHPVLHPIKKISEIYTPWSSWKIVASTTRFPSLLHTLTAAPAAAPAEPPELTSLFNALNGGINHFAANPEESIRYISHELDYTEEDARAWLDTVRFAHDVRGVKIAVVRDTLRVLRAAGVVPSRQSVAGAVEAGEEREGRDEEMEADVRKMVAFERLE